MEDEDRRLIQQLRATNDHACEQLADIMEKAHDLPDETLNIFDELRPLLGDVPSFRSIDEFLQGTRRIARGLLRDREKSNTP